MVAAPVEVRHESVLAATPDEVWAVVSTMTGVNAELLPFVRMTYPSHVASLQAADVAPGRVVFTSWLLLFGVVPFDRHVLALESIAEGEGFVEESSSWLQRRWRHERRLEAGANGTCLVTDELAIEPRVPFAAPVVRAIVNALFAHRHRRLRRRFGSV